MADSDSGLPVNRTAYLPGGIVSVDPIVTYTRESTEAPLGIASLHPELFRNRRALHFIGFSYTVNRGGLDAFQTALKRSNSELADNRFVFLANDDYEALILATLGLPVIVASNLIFIDETIYRPLAEPWPDLPVFDAVYNGRLYPFKRHELAAKVERLMLIYDYPADRTGANEERVRQVLPHAWFAQHELNGGQYRKSDPETVTRLLNQCRVGLCLSKAEGAMRASMEYLLCGLMVVSTPSIGGRDRYFMPPFARIVPPDPDAIAHAVKAMIAAPVPQQAIRDHIGRIIAFERQNFLLTANRIAHRHFGRDGLFASMRPFMRFANEWRSTAELVAPLIAAQGGP